MVTQGHPNRLYGGNIAAVYKHSQWVLILDLSTPKELPNGAEWIEAYQRWASGR